MSGARQPCLLALAVILGCEPTPIDEARLPAREQTCYEFPAGTSDAGPFRANMVRSPSCRMETIGGVAGGGGLAGAPSGEPVNPIPPAPGGDGGAGGSGNGGGSGGDSGSSSPATSDAGASEGPEPLPDGCTEQRIRELFAREVTVGGCQDSEFFGCHGGGPTAFDNTPPDLLAADLRAELLGRVISEGEGSDCSQPLITPGGGLDGSLLWRKVTSDGVALPAPCGDPMPPRDIGIAVAGTDLECLGRWILQMAGD